VRQTTEERVELGECHPRFGCTSSVPRRLGNGFDALRSLCSGAECVDRRVGHDTIEPGFDAAPPIESAIDERAVRFHVRLLHDVLTVLDAPGDPGRKPHEPRARGENEPSKRSWVATNDCIYLLLAEVHAASLSAALSMSMPTPTLLRPAALRRSANFVASGRGHDPFAGAGLKKCVGFQGIA
jgi:hypothetical protein